MINQNNYDFPTEQIRQELKKGKSIVNILIAETAPVEEKMKYSVSQSILAYQQASKNSFAELVKEIEIKGLTEKKLIDICRGKLTDFSLGELLIYANNLRINNIPCYHCGVNLYPPLLGEVLSSFKKKISFQPQKVYREHVHQSL